MDAENAHNLTFRIAEAAGKSKTGRTLAKQLFSYQHNSLSQELAGIHFPNPVGVAAGFDKNGKILSILQHSGFGHIEIGSITAQPSVGNPRPRSFRLKKDKALINRMGLNNDGADVITQRLNPQMLVPIGINIAKTHSAKILGDQAILDYAYSYKLAVKHAAYITLNISCPNTSEGKTFEDPAALNELLSAIFSLPADKPVFVKFSCDLSYAEMDELLTICGDFPLAGYIISNTSSKREQLLTPEHKLAEIGNGGLSGHPVEEVSTQLLNYVYSRVGNSKILIGVGGVMDTASAIRKIKAGASLIQLYTGLIYEGPALAGQINTGLHQYLEKHQLKSIKDIRDEH